MRSEIAELAGKLNLDPDQPVAQDRIASWYDTLVAADHRLKEVIVYLQTRKLPETLPETESIYGVIPYLVEHPDDSGIDVPEWIKDALRLLEVIGAVPKSTITTSEWKFLIREAKVGRAVDADGTIYGFEKYEQLDPNWIATIVIRELTSAMGQFGSDPETVTAPDQFIVGLVGDWGTGFGTSYGGRNPALQVITQLANIRPAPNYLIHLGDVYYAGTADAGAGPYDGEEYSYFTELWPQHRPPKSDFMLNSNHEMYSLGQGYLEVGLADPRFSHQNQTSHFLIENSYWQIFGLDSALGSPDQTTFMTGGLTTDQISWMQQQRARAQGKRVILLTHHNPITTDGRGLVGAAPNLWSQALEGLSNEQPDYWYWGHVHNAIVYTGIASGLPDPFTCHGRCVGNGAIPYGFGWGLAAPGSTSEYTQGDIPRKFTPIDSVAYFASAPVNDTDPYVKNGYAVISLDGPQITETIYDEDGTVRWTAPRIGTDGAAPTPGA